MTTSYPLLFLALVLATSLSCYRPVHSSSWNTTRIQHKNRHLQEPDPLPFGLDGTPKEQSEDEELPTRTADEGLPELPGPKEDSEEDSEEPTAAPTPSPTPEPTNFPTDTPTSAPTTAEPSDQPSLMPSKVPTISPTGSPTTSPPTVSPSEFPTNSVQQSRAVPPPRQPPAIVEKDQQENVTGKSFPFAAVIGGIAGAIVVVAGVLASGSFYQRQEAATAVADGDGTTLYGAGGDIEAGERYEAEAEA